MEVYFARLDKEIRIGLCMTASIVLFWCRRPLVKLLGARSKHGLYCSEPRATLKGIQPVEWESRRFRNQDQISSDDRRVANVKMTVAG
jgi:hypothetical protein